MQLTDMILVSFPTMAGFNARTFNETSDKEVAHVMLQSAGIGVV